MNDKYYLMDVEIYDENKDAVDMIYDIEVKSASAKSQHKAEAIALKTFLEHKYFDLTPDEIRKISMDEFVNTNKSYTASVVAYTEGFIY